LLKFLNDICQKLDKSFVSILKFIVLQKYNKRDADSILKKQVRIRFRLFSIVCTSKRLIARSIHMHTKSGLIFYLKFSHAKYIIFHIAIFSQNL